jgi:phosphate transport system permease protein
MTAVTTPTDEISILDGENSFWTYVGPLVFGTLWSAAIALAMAVPVAIGIALFISHYAPRKLSSAIGYVIDLLAAVPSVVFGLWGANVLAPAVQPFYSSSPSPSRAPAAPSSPPRSCSP